MIKIIEFDEKCNPCNGTGLYVGMGERDGYAVVCSNCKGTGCFHFKKTYEEFTVRGVRQEVSRVVEANPGIILGGSHDFGGMSYTDWLSGEKFVVGMENRKYTCPCWWYQSVDYKKKPKWDHCQLGGTFSSCKIFSAKRFCWERWDDENPRT